MSAYPMYLLSIPDTQKSLFPEVDEERKNLAHWRRVFLAAVKPKLEADQLYGEEREECQRLGIPIPTWVAVSIRIDDTDALAGVMALAKSFGGVLTGQEYGYWTGCGDGVRHSEDSLALEFRFNNEEEGERFFDGLDDVPITGADTSGLRSPYWHEAGQPTHDEIVEMFFPGLGGQITEDDDD